MRRERKETRTLADPAWLDITEKVVIKLGVTFLTFNRWIDGLAKLPMREYRDDLLKHYFPEQS